MLEFRVRAYVPGPITEIGGIFLWSFSEGDPILGGLF